MARISQAPCAICGGTDHFKGQGMSRPCPDCGGTGLHMGATKIVNVSGQQQAGGWKSYTKQGAEHTHNPHEKQAGGMPTPAPSPPLNQAPTNSNLEPRVKDLENKTKGHEVAIGIVNADVQSHTRRLDDIDVRVKTHAQSLHDLATKVNDLDAGVKTGTDIETKLKEFETQVEQRLNANRPVVVENLVTGTTVDIGRQHFMMENLIRTVQAIGDSGVAFMVGEPGSWKTSAVEELAKAMNLPYETQPVGMQTSKSDLLGFISATGQYIESPARRIYEHGGTLLWDEIVAANAAVLTIINGITANNTAGFPDRMVTRHPDCYIIVAGNTFGRGADAQFVGRSQLDAATLNRFVYLPWSTDWMLLGESLGLKVSKTEAPDFPPPGQPRQPAEYEDWLDYVKTIHDEVERLNIRAVVSSRAVINGRKMLAAGIDRGLVEYGTIWAHMSEMDAGTVRDSLNLGATSSQVEAPAVNQFDVDWLGTAEKFLVTEDSSPVMIRIESVTNKIHALKAIRAAAKYPGEWPELQLNKAKDLVEKLPTVIAFPDKPGKGMRVAEFLNTLRDQAKATFTIHGEGEMLAANSGHGMWGAGVSV